MDAIRHLDLRIRIMGQNFAEHAHEGLTAYFRKDRKFAMQSQINVQGVNIRIEGRLIRIARLEQEKYEVLSEPESVLEGLRGSGVRIDLFTFVQNFPETQPKHTYPMEWDNLAVLPVSTFEEWYSRQIRFAPRGRIRQAEKKGVKVREVPFDDSLVRGIWKVYNESPICQGKRSRHYGSDLQTVREKEATFPEKSVFVGAFLDGEMIGFLRMVVDELRKEARLIEFMSMVRHRDKCPSNALIAQGVRSCAERGVRFLIYERFAYGKKAADGLSQFKEVNGFGRVEIPRYYVPLTYFGSLAFRAGLHRNLAEHLPETLAESIRKARSAWYSWRFRRVLETLRS
jgi:hypothetical protein